MNNFRKTGFFEHIHVEGYFLLCLFLIPMLNRYPPQTENGRRFINLFRILFPVIRDQRPYYLKKLYNKFQNFYTEHFLKAGLTSLGKDYIIIRPWNIELFGAPIRIGDHAHIISASDRKTRLVVWSDNAEEGGISIGKYCLISPGVRISATRRITIGDNCMLANEAYITDADWHGIYDRVYSMGNPAPVTLKENVWIGDRAIVCKGVTIGENSIVGAGAIVTGDIPPNAVAAGNPAKVLKRLNPAEGFVKREKMFENPALFFRQLEELDKANLKNNTFLGWLRSLLFPQSRR